MILFTLSTICACSALLLAFKLKTDARQNTHTAGTGNISVDDFALRKCSDSYCLYRL
jgi:hypothetical protein